VVKTEIEERKSTSNIPMGVQPELTMLDKRMKILA
jgi:hypothetical protein